jgi:hypothetical protein
MSEDAPAHKEYKVVVGDTVKNDRKGKETYQVSMSPKLPQASLGCLLECVSRRGLSACLPPRFLDRDAVAFDFCPCAHTSRAWCVGSGA